ncbi:MAG: chitobiase/beta-hexosaminidase C-terminal domain-containing protein, partial [Melioribacteraceae bacterium]|nr:chitobiase/beta-hexosaminidase C-terminal domain-containing protein [Melioribacteraceae bacterium]
FAYGGPITLINSTTLKAKGFRNDYSPSQTISAYFNIITEVNKPQFYPSPQQIYAGAVNVNIETATLGATIRYTLDGTDPTESSNLYSGPILVSNTTTIKAKGFMEGAIESEISEATYYIISEVQRPVINPSGGQHTGSIQVTITSPTPNAVIRYTTNGTEVTNFSEIYTGPFTLQTGNHWVCAKACVDGVEPSDIVCVNYDVYNPDAGTVEMPTMTPFSSQIFVNSIPIKMDCRTEGAVIRYTVGTNIVPSDPTESGPGALTYTEPFDFGVPGGEVTFFFKVRAFKEGLNPSAIIQSGGLQLVAPVGKVEKPEITPLGGVYNNSINVTLSSATDFAQIVYTDDGEEPSTLLPTLPPSKRYNNPILLSQSKTIIAQAFRTFFEDSDTARADYIFKCANPIISPDSGNFTDSVLVTITTETLNGKIKYTLDGSIPTENSEEYTEPFALGIGNYSIKANAYRFNFIDSDVSSAEIVVKQKAEKPNLVTDLENITSVEGEKVVLKVSAEGVPAPSYQWQRNQVNLPMEISDSLVMENIQLGDAGSYRVIVSNIAGEVISEEITLTVDPLTSVGELKLSGIPTENQLYGNYPNPFNPTTKIKYGISEQSKVSLVIYNILGERVISLADDIKQPGYYEMIWNASKLSSGMYIVRFDASSTVSGNKFSKVHKLLLVK